MEPATVNETRYYQRRSDYRLEVAFHTALEGSDLGIKTVLGWLDAFLPGQPEVGYDPEYFSLLSWALFWKVDNKTSVRVIDPGEIRERLAQLMPDIRTFLTKGDGKKAPQIFLNAVLGELGD